ncbi:MAG: hypothetical protein HQK51_21085, partial [Oligoflexia bacterium]|nr:hypothetical protein [Oligoflexia bacterium]
DEPPPFTYSYPSGRAVALTKHVLDILKKHNVDRVEINIANNNKGQLLRLVNFGFIPSGQIISERWGVILTLTYYLKETNKEILQRQFFL